MWRRRPILMILAVFGFTAGLALCIAAATSFPTSPYQLNPHVIQFGGFAELETHGGHCRIDIALEGDLAWFREHVTPQGWNEDSHSSWGAFSVEIRKVRGTSKPGRIMRVYVETWWLLAGLFLPTFWLVASDARAKQKRLWKGQCVSCGYDLRATAEKCPECGAKKLDRPAAALRGVSARMWRRRPVLSSLALLSLVAGAGMAVWWGFSYDDPMNQRFCRLGGDWRIGCFKGELSIYNGDWPLRNLSQWDSDSVRLNWEGPGIALRCGDFQLGTGIVYTLFTLSLHPAYVIAAAMLLPWRWSRVRGRDLIVLAAGRCRNCGYDLRGSGDECPECGWKREA